MQLLINTNGENNTVAIYDDVGNLLSKQSLASATNQTDELLESVENILNECKAKKEDIAKILVNTNAISYTGVRVGVATANSLAISFDIPVQSILIDENIPRNIGPVSNGDKFDIIAFPAYKNEPKITKPITRN